jgi:hypothetical protein
MDSKMGLVWVFTFLLIAFFISIRFIGKPNLVFMIGYVNKAKPAIGKGLTRLFFLN